MSRKLAPAVSLLVLAACGDHEPAKPAPKPPEQVATGTVPAAKTPETRTPQEIAAAIAKAWDEDAHGLLKSFESRVYDPRRDGLVDHVEGEIAVRIEGKDSTYRFVYDAANKASDPVTVETVSQAAGVPAERAGRVRQWAIVACCGPYAFVAFYVPATQLRLAPPTDPADKTKIVWSPPFHGPLNASYVLDERQVVVKRGEWTDERNKVVTDFDWEFWRGRYLLRRSAVVAGGSTDFEYVDRSGANLVTRIRVSGGGQSGEAAFTYHDIRRRAK